MLNETKLNNNYPKNFLANNHYNVIRKDRTRNGGGVMVLINKQLTIQSTFILENIEAIHLKLKIQSKIFNFISAYRPPGYDAQTEFIEEIEEYIYSLNLNEELYLIGDLNYDLLNKESLLHNFIKHNKLINLVNKPTRFGAQFNKDKGEYIFNESLIDVILTNSTCNSNTIIVDCPFSDHSFVLLNLELKPSKSNQSFTIGRNLSSSNLEQIKDDFNNLNFSNIFSMDSANGIWLFLKKKFLIL